MTMATELIDHLDELKTERAGFEAEWETAAKFVLPTAPNILLYTDWRGTGSRILTPRTQGRVGRIYDSTAVYMVRRLAAALESLIMPQSEKWHGLAATDITRPQAAFEEQVYFELLRNFLFSARYHAKSNFVTANQQALRQLIVFGTGIYRVLENRGADQEQRPFRYTTIPIGRIFLDVNAYDIIDTAIERRFMTSRQIIQKWGDKASRRVKEAANNSSSKNTEFEVIHATFPREEAGSRALGGVRNSDFASFIIDVDEKHVMEESGYFEWPFVDYRWDPEPGVPYGTAPVMLSISDVKGANAIAKNQLRAGQQFTNPPLAMTDGVMNRPNLNPRAINPGMLDDQGRLMVQPIVTVRNPEFGEKQLEKRQAAIRESLFMNLFQILVDSPNMTATESLIRADEKGQLLGPVGSNVQQGLSFLIDRETGILTRKGAFDFDSALAPPESLSGVSFGPRFTSPLDRARRSSELLGIRNTFEIVAPMAEAEPGILDNYDFDEIARIAPEIAGAPLTILASEGDRDQKRQQRQQLQQAQAAAATVQAGGDAAGSIADAAQTGIGAAADGSALLQNTGAGDILRAIAEQTQGGAAAGAATGVNNANLVDQVS